MVDSAAVEQAYLDPYKIIPKPTATEVRVCPNCKNESLYQPFQLSYRNDARGQSLRTAKFTVHF